MDNNTAAVKAEVPQTPQKKKSKKNRQGKEIWRRYKKSTPAMIGFWLMIIVIAMAVFADVICPYSDCIKQDIMNRLQGPSMAHWFGTDEYGRDEFARIVHGSRSSLWIGVSSSVFSMAIGGFLGAIAAYYGKAVDNIIMRITDVVMTVPPILLSLAVVAALGASMTNLLIALTVSCTPGMIRLVRSVVIGLTDEEYVEAAKSYGASDLRIIFRYIVPNAMGPIIVTLTMNIASMILSASGLSYLGMGIQPPSPEWGSLLSDAESFMFTAPYLLYFPGIFIVIAALSFNLVGDGISDAFDPKLKD
jgi:ABC-type dipeptide/oligopeptide/nickel transport systems, permease components